MTTDQFGTRKRAVIVIVDLALKKHQSEGATGLVDSFARQYDTSLQQHELKHGEAFTELSQIRRLIMET